MGQGNTVPRVSGGLPWWLWLTAIVLTACVAIVILAEFNKKPTQDIFAKALEAVEDREKDAFLECKAEFERNGGSSDRLRILEGIEAMVTTRYPRAIQILEAYVDHEDPDLQSLAVKYSAEAHQAMGDAKSARLLHLRYAESNPSDVRPLLLLMGLYNASGATQLTIDTANRILELDPDDRATKEVLALALAEIGQMDEAIALAGSLLESATDRATSSPNIISQYVAWLLETGEIEAAGQFVAESSLLVVDPVAKYFALARSGQLDKAQAFIDGENYEQANGVTLWQDAARAMESEDWEQAVRLLGQVTLKLPRDAFVYEALEQAAKKNEQPDLAEACRANVESIKAIEQEKLAAIRAIGDDMQNVQLRMNVAQQAARLSAQVDLHRWVQAAVAVAKDSKTPTNEFRFQYTMARTPLVPISGAFGLAPSGESGLPSEEDPEKGEAASDGTDDSESPDEPKDGSEEKSEADDQAEPEASDRSASTKPAESAADEEAPVDEIETPAEEGNASAE